MVAVEELNKTAHSKATKLTGGGRKLTLAKRIPMRTGRRAVEITSSEAVAKNICSVKMTTIKTGAVKIETEEAAAAEVVLAIAINGFRISEAAVIGRAIGATHKI